MAQVKSQQFSKSKKSHSSTKSKHKASRSNNIGRQSSKSKFHVRNLHGKHVRIPNPSRRKPSIKVNNSTNSTTEQTQLERIQALLDLIWHRNKNQFRSQPWWRWLSYLKRSIRELVSIEVHYQNLQSSQQSLSETSNQIPTAEDVRKRLSTERDLETKRDSWMTWTRDVVVPKVYASISALVADVQFAALGVVLIGLLSEVASLVGYTEIIDDEKIESTRNGLIARLRKDPVSGKSNKYQTSKERFTSNEERARGKITSTTRIQDNDASTDLGIVIARNSAVSSNSSTPRVRTPSLRPHPTARRPEQTRNSEERLINNETSSTNTNSPNLQEPLQTHSIPTIKSNPSNISHPQIPETESRHASPSPENLPSSTITTLAATSHTIQKSSSQKKHRTNPTDKPKDPSLSQPPQLQKVEKEAAKDNNKKRDKKRTKKNAIDDLFTGFG